METVPEHRDLMLGLRMINHKDLVAHKICPLIDKGCREVVLVAALVVPDSSSAV